MKKHSKRFKEALKIVKSEKAYNLDEALASMSKTPAVKFDETVELNFRLGVDPKQSTQMVRGTVRLPNGSGKKVRVIVFTENAQAALDAGAEFAGLKDMIEKVQGGWMDFDVAISTTSAMKEVRSLARVLGPRGLMPNPKSGTVSDDVISAIQDVKAGRVEYKMDKTANMAVVVGKRSFEASKLKENAEAALKSVLESRPDGIKGQYITNVTLASTMGPGLKLSSDLYTSKSR
ncbi:MAG: 50S ribosomal protein L1 [Verrucomicrobia bacterium CG1_02_43_26]|nr:MAG: 50S ribosomal protein L1 [Verrucomicrobia bacterium CG1_02_43_26]